MAFWQISPGRQPRELNSAAATREVSMWPLKRSLNVLVSSSAGVSTYNSRKACLNGCTIRRRTIGGQEVLPDRPAEMHRRRPKQFVRQPACTRPGPGQHFDHSTLMIHPSRQTLCSGCA